MFNLSIYAVIILSIFSGMVFYCVGSISSFMMFEYKKPKILNIFLAITVIASILTSYKTFDFLNEKRITKEKIETILNINEDFLNSGKTVNSLSDAKMFKIISDEQISETKNISSFSFQGKSLTIYIKEKNYEECISIIPELYKNLSSHTEATININGISLSEATRSNANLSYECSKKQITITSTF